MKKITLYAIIGLLIFGFAGCSEQTEEEPLSPTEVKIAGLKGPSSMGMIKMIDEEITFGENISVDYDIVPAPDTLVAKLLNGEYDFATLPTNTASIIYNKKEEYQVSGICTWGMLYVVTNGVEINQWQDFSGKTVSPFAQASTPDILFKYLLNLNGLEPEKDVLFDYSFQQAELVQAFAAGQVSIAVLPEPFVTSVTMKNSDVQIPMNLQEEWKNAHATSSVLPVDASYPMTAVVVRKEFADEHPEIVTLFMDQYEESVNWVNLNPAEASLLIEKHDLGLAAKAAENAIPRCNIDLVRTSDSKQLIEFYLNVFNEFSPQSIGGKLPDENFYYGE